MACPWPQDAHRWVANRIAVLFEPVMRRCKRGRWVEKLFLVMKHGGSVCRGRRQNGPSLVSVGDAVGLGGILPHGAWAWGRRAQNAFCQAAQAWWT